MQGHIVQALAIAAAANANLSGRETTLFWPNASVFTFTKRCGFRDGAGNLVAPNPPSWIAGLMGKSSGVWLHATPRSKTPGEDRKTVGFAGGGPRWILETVRQDASSLWEGRDAVLTQNDPQGKNWATVYAEIANDWRHKRPAMRALADIIATLRAALTDIAGLAHDGDLTGFEASFREALARLDDTRPLVGAYHADIADIADFSPEGRRLFGALHSAWVFGAMGSWNDTGVPGQEERYDALSEKLFGVLVESVVALANSTYPTAAPRPH